MASLKAILAEEDTRIALIWSTCVVTPVLTAAGFYLGTIVGKPWVKDYQPQDMQDGLNGALVGGSIGLLIVAIVVFVYSNVALKDIRHEYADILGESH